MSHPSARVLATTAALLSLLACGDDDPSGPSRSSVAGTYTATTFTIASGGPTTDLLDEGASVTLVLSQQGTTSGRLFVPAGAEGTEELDADLAGTWSLSGTTVRFSQAADSFIRDVPFEVRGNTLVGDQTFAGTRVQVTLTKQ